MKSISQLSRDQINKKIFLVRVDINVPIFDGKILDNSRIIKSLPTIEFLINKGGKVILISHLGRPKGKFDESLSIKQLIPQFRKKFQNITFIEDIKSSTAEDQIKKAVFGSLIICENIRFYSEETENNQEFSAKIAKYADFYVNEAFSCSHRAHASVTGFAKFLPSYAGFLLENEIKNLENILKNQKKSEIIAIVGGSKVSTKIDLLNSLIEKVNCIVIGGGMANTFLFARGVNIGNSLCEKNLAPKALEILEKAQKINCEIIIPQDVVTTKKLEKNTESESKSLAEIGDNDIIADIGKQSVANILEKISSHKKVIWNGPLGVCEILPFEQGTTAVAHKIAQLTDDTKLTSVAGGGDVVCALQNLNLTKNFSYISTAGGAFLEWLEGRELPGIKVL
jgi:phosphoglycerate kinase